MAEMKRKYTHYKETDDSKIRFEENGRKIIFLNPNRKLYERVHVDGDEFGPSDQERCDYMLARYDYAQQGESFVNPNDLHEEYFIELKGSDIIKGTRQLEASIKCLSVNPKGLCKYAFIIGTNVSPILNTKIQRVQDKFERDYNTKLIIKKNKYSHELY